MNRLPNEPSREEVLKFISKSASYGNLGLFMGAGFTKAVLNDNLDNIALSWAELLEKVSTILGVDYESIDKEGIGYPEIASKICQEYSKSRGKSYSTALKKLKATIASLTCWYPDHDKREEFSKYLNCLSPSWIITTNYDLIIEALLTGKSIPLGPNDQLTSPLGIIPVYHLHGVRTNPEEIIIAQEDYISLFRPTEYRQIKLALTVKESTTLLIGYGLGDVNVLTALDWSKSVFISQESSCPNEVIQLLRTENPRENPYRDKNGILIVETQELKIFFDEYMTVRETELDKEQTEREALDTILEDLTNPDQNLIERFIVDARYRKALIGNLATFPVDLIAGFISFIDKCINETWARSAPDGAFEGYNENLKIILDILTGFNVQKIPPALFQTAAYALDRVAWYVGHGVGESWAAGNTWERRKGELSREMIEELNNIAKQHGYTRLKHLLDTIS